MKTILRSTVALLCFASLPALAENCAKISGRAMCLTFHYSTGFSNQYTAFFRADGSFHLLEDLDTSGTWSCAGGRGLVDVEYLFGGFEQQSWYAKAGAQGKSLKGYGRAVGGDYMYDFSGAEGECAAVPNRQTTRQDQ